MGGSGGGGGSYTSWKTERLTKAVRIEQGKSVEMFNGHLAGYLSDLLAAYNSRDTDKVRERLEQCKTILRETVEKTLDHLYGFCQVGRDSVEIHFIVLPFVFLCYLPQRICSIMTAASFSRSLALGTISAILSANICLLTAALVESPART